MKTSEQPRLSPGDVAYPPELKTCETAAIRQRRAAAGLPAESAEPGAASAENSIGLALSGGGIRSATFCLGVLQALARFDLLRQVDYLSTVSGGGYIGAFWGGLVNRNLGQPPAEAPAALKKAQESVANPGSTEIRWLRENGRYLTPAGSSDAWLAATVYQRNFFTLQFVLTLLAFTGLFALAIVGSTALFANEPAGWLSDLGSLTWPLTFKWGPVEVIASRILWTGAVVLLGLSVLLGIVYWSVSGEMVRNHVTRQQAFVSILALWVASFAAIDTAGATLAWAIQQNHGLISVPTLATAIATFMAGSKRVRGLFTRASGSSKEGQSSQWMISLGALVLALLWSVTLSALAHGLFWFIKDHDSWPKGALWLVLGGLVLLLLAVGRVKRLVNRTGLSAFYSARLSRTYLGASNPARAKHRDVTEMIEGDQIEYADYFPHLAGGPLHLINVTVNETLDPVSAVVRQDRKGVPMAIGPCAISVGKRHHALWETEEVDNLPRRTGAVRAASHDMSFHLWNTEKEKIGVEMCSLGQWVGISGAAFTTGLGARTELSLSFLIGFFNVRLGWWWDSGVAPSSRKGAAKRPVLRLPGQILSWLFRTQSQLIAELTARFNGTARREWYLSDGGHFENTAAYELIRRRVKLIIICDVGCDPGRIGEDFANLARKARLDFDAQIDSLEPREIALLPKDLQERVTTLEELYSPNRAGLQKAAMVARVRYADTGQTSVLLLIKPTICGDELAPERNYGALNPDFPQQSTIDQFFDEAQWESYRALGETIATALFSTPDGKPRRLDPGEFLPPA